MLSRGSRCIDVTGSWLRFDAGSVSFAIDLSCVREIRRLPVACPLPNVAPWVAGITNLRGRILPVLDPALALGLGQMDLRNSGRRSRLVVVDSGSGPGTEAGLAVDRVRGVATGVEVLPPVDGLPPEMRRYCSGTLRVDDGLAALLDSGFLEGLKETAAVSA